jgi:hypothetical protein
MLESDVREELEALNILVQGVKQLRSGRRDQDPVKDRPLTPILSYLWREGLRCPEYDHSPNSTACESRWSRTWHRKAQCNASAASDWNIRSTTADKLAGASHVRDVTSVLSAQPLGGQS